MTTAPEPARRREVPARLAGRPFHHGLPVPWVSGMRDGVPVFGVNDERKRIEAVRKELCGQCGERLDYWKAFVGDRDNLGKRLLMEPAMHEDCARYALAVCPYLLRSDWAVGNFETDDEHILVPWGDKPTPRDGPIYLLIARSYKVVTDFGVVYLRPSTAKRVEEFA